MLYTGDEMGYIIKWDISKLIEKLKFTKPKELSEDSLDENGKKKVNKTTFFTQPNELADTVSFNEKNALKTEDIV